MSATAVMFILYGFGIGMLSLIQPPSDIAIPTIAMPRRTIATAILLAHEVPRHGVGCGHSCHPPPRAL